jgi:RNA polymerase sigma factor (sigma-70 family)
MKKATLREEALESVGSYDPARGADQWPYGIVRNVLGTSYRQGRVDAGARERLGLPALVLDDQTLQTIARLNAAHGEATLALAELPDEQQQAIEARVLEEREYAEIAKELCCSEAVVRQRVSRAPRISRHGHPQRGVVRSAPTAPRTLRGPDQVSPVRDWDRRRQTRRYTGRGRFAASPVARQAPGVTQTVIPQGLAHRP